MKIETQNFWQECVEEEKGREFFLTKCCLLGDIMLIRMSLPRY